MQGKQLPGAFSLGAEVAQEGILLAGTYTDGLAAVTADSLTVWAVAGLGVSPTQVACTSASWRTRPDSGHFVSHAAAGPHMPVTVHAAGSQPGTADGTSSASHPMNARQPPALSPAASVSHLQLQVTADQVGPAV